MIRDYGFSSDFKYVILRYFNVAGADLVGRIGQSSPKASHLMRVACDAALGNIPAVGYLVQILILLMVQESAIISTSKI